MWVEAFINFINTVVITCTDVSWEYKRHLCITEAQQFGQNTTSKEEQKVNGDVLDKIICPTNCSFFFFFKFWIKKKGNIYDNLRILLEFDPHDYFFSKRTNLKILTLKYELKYNLEQVLRLRFGHWRTQKFSNPLYMNL